MKNNPKNVAGAPERKRRVSVAGWAVGAKSIHISKDLMKIILKNKKEGA